MVGRLRLAALGSKAPQAESSLPTGRLPRQTRGRGKRGRQACEMFGLLLAIDHRHRASFEQLDQMDKRHFGRVRCAREHRFTEEHAADGHAVQSSDQRIAPPACFDQNAHAQPMQLAVRV